MGPVEDYRQTEPDNSDREEEIPLTAADIVSDSIVSGALSGVCEVTAVMRELGDRENDLVKDLLAGVMDVALDPRRHHVPCSSQGSTISPSEPPSLR